jgi:tetratricopeptide (TPR) repeat protein
LVGLKETFKANLKEGINMKTGVRKQIGVVLLVILLFLSSCVSTPNKTQTELRDARAYNKRGIAYWSKGQYDQAILDYNKALEINPRYADAYNNRGVAYADTGQYDQAILDYNKALEINPGYAYAYKNRAVSYYFKREYYEALKDVNKAQALGLKIPPEFLSDLRKASGRQE